MNSSDQGIFPAAEPPPGVIPNFDHPQSRAIVEYVGVGICLGVTLIFVLLRVYVKLVVTHAWGWDDGACLLGYGLITAFAGVNFSLTTSKESVIGKHQWEYSVKSFTKGYFQSHIASVAFYSSATFFVKLSLLLLYLRLFKVDKTTRWLIYGGIFVIGLFYSITLIFNTAIESLPPDQPDTDESWQMHVGRIISILKSVTVAQGVFGILSDIYLLVIPIRIIFRLHLPIKRKFGVSSIFLIGIIAISCSVAAFYYRIEFLHDSDSSWSIVVLWCFTTAEICAGIICGCMLILRPLFTHHVGHKSPFASLAGFMSRFSFRTFRQPSTSQQNHFENKSDDKIELKSGIEFTKASEPV